MVYSISMQCHHVFMDLYKIFFFLCVRFGSDLLSVILRLGI